MEQSYYQGTSLLIFIHHFDDFCRLSRFACGSTIQTKNVFNPCPCHRLNGLASLCSHESDLRMIIGTLLTAFAYQRKSFIAKPELPGGLPITFDNCVFDRPSLTISAPDFIITLTRCVYQPQPISLAACATPLPSLALTEGRIPGETGTQT
jgi:hypothetical protein